MGESLKENNLYATLCREIIRSWPLGLRMIADFLKDIQHRDELELIYNFVF